LGLQGKTSFSFYQKFFEVFFRFFSFDAPRKPFVNTAFKNFSTNHFSDWERKGKTLFFPDQIFFLFFKKKICAAFNLSISYKNLSPDFPLRERKGNIPPLTNQIFLKKDLKSSTRRTLITQRLKNQTIIQWAGLLVMKHQNEATSVAKPYNNSKPYLCPE